MNMHSQGGLKVIFFRKEAMWPTLSLSFAALQLQLVLKCSSFTPGTVQLSTLGVPFQLGMLYDDIGSRLIPGLTLWSTELIESSTHEVSARSSQVDLTTLDSLDAAFKVVQAEIDSKMNFFEGKLSLRGFGKILTQKHSSNQEFSLSLVYKSTTVMRELTMAALKVEQMEHLNVARVSGATHVVAAVLYGADCAFTFHSNLLKHKDNLNITAQVGLDLGKFSLKANLTMNSEINHNSSLYNMSCRFCGDFILDANPTTYVSAKDKFRKITKFLGSNFEHTVVKQVWLLPLYKLISETAMQKASIPYKHTIDIEEIFDATESIERQVEDIRTSVPSVNLFTILDNCLIEFKLLLTAFTNWLTQNLGEIVPDVKLNGQGTLRLDNLLESIGKSPFNKERLETWLNAKHTEALILQNYYEIFNSHKFITKALDSYSLNGLINDIHVEQLFVFKFSLLYHIASEPFLALMRDFVADKRTIGAEEIGKIVESLENGWFMQSSTTSHLVSDVKNFTIWAKTNAAKGLKIQFLISSEAAPSNKIFKTHRLYKFVDTVRTEFTIVTQPTGLAATFINEDFVTVSWKEPANGQLQIASYEIDIEEKTLEDGKVVKLARNSGKATRIDLLIRPNCMYKIIVNSLSHSSIVGLPSDPLIFTTNPSKEAVNHCKSVDQYNAQIGTTSYARNHIINSTTMLELARAVSHETFPALVAIGRNGEFWLNQPYGSQKICQYDITVAYSYKLLGITDKTKQAFADCSSDISIDGLLCEADKTQLKSSLEGLINRFASTESRQAVVTTMTTKLATEAQSFAIFIGRLKSFALSCSTFKQFSCAFPLPQLDSIVFVWQYNNSTSVQ